jgi:hypothetical protein
MCDLFSSWIELKQSLNGTILSNLGDHDDINIVVHPSKPIMLTSDIDIEQLVGVFNGGVWLINYQPLTLKMIGVAGIDVAFWTANLSDATDSPISILFENSQVEFYRNGTSLASDEECFSKDMISGKTANHTFFDVFSSVGFESSDNKFLSNEPICPYIFSKAQLDWIDIKSQFDSLLINNIWRFKSFNNSNLTTINSSIQSLHIQGYGYNLDTSLMNPLVFEATELLAIHGSIGSIQADLFKYLNKTNQVLLTLDSFKNFFHKIGIKWTTSLNMIAQPLVFFSSTYFWINGPAFTYPDTDFCLFAQYSNQDNLTYVLNSQNYTECTSTIRWLLSNYFSHDKSSVLNAYPTTKLIFSICANSSKRTFDFDTLLARCNLTRNADETAIYPEYFQIQFFFEFIEDLVIFVAIPCACLLGLVLNILIIRAVHKNKEKELKDDFYSYMSLNAVFNCFYCVIFIFYPINACIDSLASSLCSSIRKSFTVQYYKILFIAYFGETFKMCANISYILMNINRYMLIGREHKPLFQKISKWNFKWVVGLTLIISGLINIGHGFQYELNDGSEFTWPGLSDDIYAFNVHISDSYPYDYSIDNSLPLFTYILLYFLINFVMFFVVNTWVEVTIVRKLHSELTLNSLLLTEEFSFKRKITLLSIIK